MIPKVSLTSFAICTGAYSSSTEAISDATSHGCSVVEITNGFIRGFVPVHQGKLVTCRYGGMAYKMLLGDD